MSGACIHYEDAPTTKINENPETGVVGNVMAPVFTRRLLFSNKLVVLTATFNYL